MGTLSNDSHLDLTQFDPLIVRVIRIVAQVKLSAPGALLIARQQTPRLRPRIPASLASAQVLSVIEMERNMTTWLQDVTGIRERVSVPDIRSLRVQTHGSRSLCTSRRGTCIRRIRFLPRLPVRLHR